MEKYDNSGALFVRDKKTQNAPDYGGDISLDGEVLDYILRKAERGEPVKLEISGWLKQGRNNGTRFISINGKIPYNERNQNQPYNAPSFVPNQRQMQQPSRPVREGIQTSRGQYTQQGGQVGHSQNTGQRQMRNILNDDIPDNFGGQAPRRRAPVDSPPWDD